MLKGGDKLISKLNDLAKETKTLKVGFFKNSTYPDGTHVAKNAFWQEYGTPKIPPRPFFRTAIAQNKGKWSKGFENVLVKNNYDYDKAFRLLGVKVAYDIRMSIVNWSEPANAPYTVAQKGFNDPLVKTHNMEKSVNWEYD